VSALQNPYKVLYWLGAGVALLLIGIVALVVLTRRPPAEALTVERTLIWMQAPGQSSGVPALVVLEEARDSRTLTAVPFPAPSPTVRVFAEQGSRRAQAQLAAWLQRRLHHRVFLPMGVLSTLIDAAGGISLEGRTVGGSAALAYISEGGEQGARRAGLVLLALTDAVSAHGINMGVSQGLSLARQVDTDLDLTSLPDVFARWAAYGSPRIESPTSYDPMTIQQLLRPDPVPATLLDSPDVIAL